MATVMEFVISNGNNNSLLKQIAMAMGLGLVMAMVNMALHTIAR